MASKTTRKTTSLNSGQLRSLETSLADAYNLAGLNDIKHDKDKQQRKDVIGNIDNPSYSKNNKTKIENFKRHLPWKLQDAKVEGITNLESFFDAIKKSSANLSSYPNLANLKENLSTKVTVESPPRSMPPTRNVPKALPPSSSRSSVHIASERGAISFPGSGSPLKSNIPSPPPNYLAPSYKAQAEEEARREAEEKARREAEAKAKAQAPKQANQAKDNPSLLHSFATSLLQQNFQNTNQQARLPEKTDDKKENSLQNWMALVGGLLKKQEEKNKPELLPQKDPPPIDTQRGKPKEVQKTASEAKPSIPQIPTKASEYYSHSLDIYRLQKKFDENHNISYDQIKNDNTYFDQRVAKWDAELKDIGLKTALPRKPNEQRLMGFEGYIKYLDSNIKQLQTQELTQEKLQSGKNPSVNQQKLKTLIAFHYLEMAKAFYSSGQLHMDGIEGEYFKKESVFDMVPRKYKEHLTERDTSINSYRLPGMEKENIRNEVLKIESLIKNYFPKEHLGRMPQSVLRGGGNPNLNPSTTVRALNKAKDGIVAAREFVMDQARKDYYYMNGPTIVSALKSAKEGATKIVDFVGRRADDFADGMVNTGVRATPAEMRMPNKIKGDTGLGYQTIFPSVHAHNSRLREERDQASKLHRDTQHSALEKNLSQRRSERVLAMHNQVCDRNFHGPYNATHGGRSGGR